MHLTYPVTIPPMVQVRAFLVPFDQRTRFSLQTVRHIWAMINLPTNRSCCEVTKVNNIAKRTCRSHETRLSRSISTSRTVQYGSHRHSHVLRHEEEERARGQNEIVRFRCRWHIYSAARDLRSTFSRFCRSAFHVATSCTSTFFSRSNSSNPGVLSLSLSCSYSVLFECMAHVSTCDSF